MTEFKEKYRLTLSNAGKIRNRAEAHLIEFAQRLLALPTKLTIKEVRAALVAEQERTTKEHPSWGGCRVSELSIASKMANAHHLVTRNLAIYGRGRGIYSLLISETVMKNITINCAPVIY
jgi:hypothetical protein